MELTIIDLYEYFKIKRGNGYSGYLRCYNNIQANQTKFCNTHKGILIIPGGGYTHVSTREGEPIALKFLANDYNAYILDYTVYPNGYYPCQLLEGAMAMIYLRENQKKLNISDNSIYAIGFSAGGHLCASIGTMFDDKIIKETFKEKYKLIRPDAMVLSYPVISTFVPTSKETFENITNKDQELTKYLSLEKKVNRNTPPTFLWHTANDEVVPAINSIVFAEALANNNIPYELHIYEKGPHGGATIDTMTYPSNYNFSSFSEAVKDWVNLVIKWLEKY